MLPVIKRPALGYPLRASFFSHTGTYARFLRSRVFRRAPIPHPVLAVVRSPIPFHPGNISAEVIEGFTAENGLFSLYRQNRFVGVCSTMSGINARATIVPHRSDFSFAIGNSHATPKSFTADRIHARQPEIVRSHRLETTSTVRYRSRLPVDRQLRRFRGTAKREKPHGRRWYNGIAAQVVHYYWRPVVIGTRYDREGKRDEGPKRERERNGRLLLTAISSGARHESHDDRGAEDDNDYD